MSDNGITNSNGIVGGWTHLISEESPAENVGPGDDGIESLAEPPSVCEKVTCSPAAPETGDGTAPPGGVEPGDGPPDDAPLPEAPVESLGPEGDGRCSPAEMPGLSEEVTGPVAEERREEGGLPAEAALSEEGLQVCQETRSEGSAPSSPSALSPSPSSHVPLISDQESHAPFSPHTDACAVTSPCSDTDGLIPVSSTSDIDSHISSAPELLAADIPTHDIYTHVSSAPEPLAADIPAHDIDSHTSSAPELLAADIPAHDIYTHASSAPELLAADIPAHDIYTHASSAPELLAAAIPAHDIYTHSGSAPESLAPVSSAPDTDTDASPASEPPTLESQHPASVPPASVLESQEGEEPQKEEVMPEPAHILADVVPPEDIRGDSYEAAEGDGLRRRHVPPPAHPEPPRRARDEEEEEEEEEFHLIEKKKEEGGWFSLNKCIVGALVLLCLGSIIFTGYFLDLDDEEDFAPPRDQELHGKQERLNPDGKLPDPKEVSQLLGKLAEDNQQMAILQAQLQKEELDLVLHKAEETGKESPAGQIENHTSVHSGLWEEQNVPALEEGDTGQEGAQLGRGPGNGAREEEEERKTERVEKPAGRDGERKREWEGRVREVRRVGHQEKVGKKGREESKEWRHREERKEKREESDWKHRKDGEKKKHREWKEKVEKRRAWEKGREWYKGGERKREGAWKDKTERKDQRHDRWRAEKKEKDWKAQKEGWKAQKDWREERGMDKDKSKKEKHWQGSAAKKPLALDHVDYWKRQQEKLRRNRPPVDCRGVEECARKERLVPVTQAEFQALLGSYLGKLGDGARESKAAVLSLVGEFFADGVFAHHKVPFREFAEDVADVLEDVAEGDRHAEEEVEEFEREALRRFAVPGGGEREGRRRGKDGRMWG
ncbi:pre-B-cell leukemia transcription factor-interacting protein 1 isoform X1 [Anguilla anguilla]|uniref:pre-B-cell leukemia transcription factor-interacting protein 1 isoform X1 n=1 Tax=Anguilla anguilla TaxID=7936 RepID=UPI0015AE5279|nr:pre-B-cell leukemia transcription factor-interacting protein 1 isoform X1 [Anguilla anguilla]